MSERELLESSDDVVAYLLAAGLLSRLATSASEVMVREVTAGNMNRVYIAAGPAGSLAIKQAPPFVQVAGPGWPMSPARIGAEAAAYKLLASLAPDAVPDIVHVDLDRFVLVMEDLSDLRVLRDVLVDQLLDEPSRAVPDIDFVQLGTVVGTFVGRLSRATSESTLGAQAHTTLVTGSASPELCALTLDVVLDEPYREHDHNHWHPALETRVRALYTDEAVHGAVAGIRDTFTGRTQALLHGDLHTGSVMLGVRSGRQAVKVFDPEFSFVGPIGLDLGLFWANLVIAATAARALGRTALADARESAIMASWRAFTEAWHDTPTVGGALAEGSEAWLESVREDAWRFAGVEAMRRVAGYSHAADLETLPPNVAATAQQTVFDLAKHWILTGSRTMTDTLRASIAKERS